MRFDKLHICKTTTTIKIEYFFTSKSLLAPLCRRSSLHACVQATTALLSLQTSLHCLEFCVNGITQHILYWAWLLSGSTVILRFILVAYITSSSFYWPFAWIYHILFIDLPAGGHLGGLQCVAIMNMTAGNICGSLCVTLYLDKYLEVEQLGHTVRLCFVRHCHTVF